MAEQTPRRPMDQWDDPELASLFRDEPDLYDLSRNLRASRPEPVVGTHFEPYLRARLIDAAARELKPRGLSRWLRPRPGLFAGGGAALGVAMIAAVVVATVMYQPHDTRVDLRGTNVAENHDASPDQVIRASFTQDVDHAAVEHNLQIHPATAVVTRWEGTTLVITPLHRLAANTPYTVTIPRTAVRTASGATAPSDIRIAFGTKATPSPGPTQAPAPPPSLQPVVLGPVSAGSEPHRRCHARARAGPRPPRLRRADPARPRRFGGGLLAERQLARLPGSPRQQGGPLGRPRRRQPRRAPGPRRRRRLPARLVGRGRPGGGQRRRGDRGRPRGALPSGQRQRPRRARRGRGPGSRRPGGLRGSGAGLRLAEPDRHRLPVAVGRRRRPCVGR